ncbi:DUF6286 domain-containing protein [Zhihengliuella salsuginis]|uniref:Alkaline shock response membrane anchor protein AmaP n=1 Tax=Zhihengliuella salsuginis TaxID=578222 RepID=A0ABQ3G9N5_9MICC|nr:DUF6286 domain-containing protein [Zhihengliuella salsuginis]GHC99023.1 hypothetical protein GCM10008096_00700 [Zhihengliuella salsuginis]
MSRFEPRDAERERYFIQRRQTHSARSFASIVAAVLVALICLYFMFEAALKSIGQDVWLKSPGQWWSWIAALPGDAGAGLVGAGSLVLLLLGLFFVLQGLLPGRKARRAIENDRAIVIIDHEVLASTLARRARTEANVSPEQVMVAVAHAHVDVQVRPTSGIPVDADAIRAAVADELAENLIDPVPPVTVRVADTGVVGQ